MKSGTAAKKAAFIGAGAGLALFALTGLLPSSFFGGIIGINIAGGIFGLPLKSDLLPRITVAISMLIGVLVTGSVFVACGTMIGWALGNVIDVIPRHAYFNGRSRSKHDPDDNSGTKN